MSGLLIYEEPKPNDRESFTVAEDDEYFYDLLIYFYNHRLVMTPKTNTWGWDWGWCFAGAKELTAGLFVWNPMTQNEPLGWHKRPTGPKSRVAPLAEQEPQYNRLRCVHGQYPDDGPCVISQFCEVHERRQDATWERPAEELSWR